MGRLGIEYAPDALYFCHAFALGLVFLLYTPGVVAFFVGEGSIYESFVSRLPTCDRSVDEIFRACQYPILQ